MKVSELVRSPLGKWILVNVVCQGLALAAFGLGRPGAVAASLGWTALFGWAFWYPWVLAPIRSRRGLHWAFWSLWLAWLALSVAHRRFLGTYPDHGSLEFSLSEPTYALVLAWDRIAWWMLPAGLVPVGLGWWLSRGEAGPAVSRPWRLAGLATTAILLVLCDQKDLSPRLMGADVTTLRMLSETRARRIGSGGLRRALGRQLPPAGPAPAWNVLILVHESLNTQAFDPALMPGLGARLAAGEVLAFPQAYAPASMTDVALPALFSGISPAQPSAAFHRVPLLWHHAKAHGMATALFSVQRYNYYGFTDFFLADGLDAILTADRDHLKLMNDTGGDDALLVDRFAGWLKEKEGQPTFTVLHFNATHAPYLQAPGFTRWTPADVARLRPDLHPSRREDLARYWNALSYLDHQQEQILNLLKSRGLLDRTWVIATSDHGEAFEGQAQGRMEDLRPGAIQVPLWMRLPASFPAPWKEGLAANRTRLVGNLDVAPTLAAAFGDAWPSDLMPGHSLLLPLPGERRPMALHNSGEIRARKPEVAGFLWEEEGLISAWRWHGQEGSAFTRIAGERETPQAGTSSQLTQVRTLLGAHPVLLRAGVKP